jgi:hypothetical protein
VQPAAQPECIGGDEKKRSLIRAATLGGATGLLIVAVSFLALVLCARSCVGVMDWQHMVGERLATAALPVVTCYLVLGAAVGLVAMRPPADGPATPGLRP